MNLIFAPAHSSHIFAIFFAPSKHGTVIKLLPQHIVHQTESQKQKSSTQRRSNERNLLVLTIFSRLKCVFKAEILAFKTLIYANLTKLSPEATTRNNNKTPASSLKETTKIFSQSLIEFVEISVVAKTARDDLAISARLKR